MSEIESHDAHFRMSAGLCAKYIPVVSSIPLGGAIVAGAAIGFAIAGCYYSYQATH